MMKQSVRSLACLLAGAVLCSAAAVEAQPVVLTQEEMDGATAGLRPDVAARLATLRSRLAELREQVRDRLEDRERPHKNQRSSTVSESRSWKTTNAQGSVTTDIQIVRTQSYSSRVD